MCVSSQSEQYINFSDSGLFEKLIDSGTDKNGDGMISVTEMESLNGAFGFDGVSDVSGLEYAGPDLKLSGDGWTAPVKDVFALQSYRSMEMLENARRNIDIYSRIAMKDYREDISYSSSDPEIAKVSKEEYKDVICTGKAGVATITAFCAGLSKSFEVTVVSADKPMGEKTNNIPELLTKDSYNADGVINSVDALRVLQHSVNVIQLQGRAAKRADVSKDEKINPVDALDILRYSVGMIKDFS